MRTEQQITAFSQQGDGIIGSAQLAGAIDDGIHHRLDVGRRRGNHVEDGGAAGLVCQSLRQLARPYLNFLEQPRVLDRDHRLIGKGRNKLDLFFGERPHRLPRQHEHADRAAIAEQGYAQPGTGGVGVSPQIEPGFCQHVMDMNDVSPDQNSSREGGIARPESEALQEFFLFGRQPPICGQAEAVIFRLKDDPLIRLAQLRSRLDKSVQHGLQIERRTADDLEHVGGCSLLLQRFGKIVGALAKFVEQARILDGDYGLRCELLEQRDLLFGEALALLPKDHDKADNAGIFEQWYSKETASPSKVYQRAPVEIASDIGLRAYEVLDFGKGFALQEAVQSGTRTVFQGGTSSSVFFIGWGAPLGGRRVYPGYRQSAYTAP